MEENALRRIFIALLAALLGLALGGGLVLLWALLTSPEPAALDQAAQSAAPAAGPPPGLHRQPNR